MCDCSQKQDDKISEKIVSETVETITLFSKCPAYYSGKDDILERTISIESDRTSTNSILSNSSDMIYNSIKTLSTESSSSSSRIYKFVCPTENEYFGEEESSKLLPICYEPKKVEEVIEIRPDIEYTLAIIKPEAVIYRKEIEYRIYEEGFGISQVRWLQLTPEQVAEFYSNCFGELSFPHLVAYMSSGSIIVYVLGKQNGIEEWKKLMGPTTVAEARLYFPDSIRAKYGSKGDNLKNAVHGSCNRKEAEREIHFFFPDFILEPLLKDDMAEDFLWETINPILVKGLTLCCKQKPADAILWLAHWLILNNPNKPKLPEDLALIPS